MNTTYRLKIWYLLLNITLAWFVLSMLAGALVALIVVVLLIIFLLQQGEWQSLGFLVMFAGILAVIVPLWTLAGIVLPLGNALFSYLRISSTGLELRVWPGYRLRCHWHQVTGLEQIKIFGGRLSLPMLRYKEAEIKSWRDYRWYIRLDPGGPRSEFIEHPASFSFLDSLFLWSVDHHNLIPVYIFNGWPNGKLRQELERRLGQISF
jgi:hypothetical protein